MDIPKKLPIGIENFEKLRTEEFYYVDKTGCLRIAKESVFTGLNNFNVMSVTDVLYDEYFGFSDEEVQIRSSEKSLSSRL